MRELTRLSDDGTPPAAVNGVPVLGFTIMRVVFVRRIDTCTGQHGGFMELYTLILMLQHVLQHSEGTLPCQIYGEAHQLAKLRAFVRTDLGSHVLHTIVGSLLRVDSLSQCCDRLHLQLVW